MAQSRVVLRRFADSVEAETLRSRLAVAGITAFVFGTDNATALSMGGAGVISGVRVEIATDDLQEAEAILREDERVRQVAGDWICNRCDEQNDATFELCWSCQKSRNSDDERVASQSPTVDALKPPTVLSEKSNGSGTDAIKDSNPYRPVLVDPDAAYSNFEATIAESVDEEEIDNELRSLSRITIASAVSSLILPVPLSIYAIYRISAIPKSKAHHPRIKPKLRKYLVINAVLTCFVLIFWLVMWMA